MTVASFNNIRDLIIRNIDCSRETISISVAWFTSQHLLGKLIDKLEEGCKIEIVISDHKENSRLNYVHYLANGGQVYILSTLSGKFLHEKFALFDNKKLIAGSYNWTNSAEFYNHEFIIHSDDQILIQQFNIRFAKLKKVVSQYDKQKLVRQNDLTAETREEEFIQLEHNLKTELINSINLAVEAGAHINKHVILEQIFRYGAIGAANRIILEGIEKLHSGLTKLFIVNRLDLAIEHIIQKDSYRQLFTPEILEKAKQRLDILTTNRR